MRLPVEHQLVGPVEKPRRPEDEGGLSVLTGLEQDARTAKGAIGQGDGHTADHLVEHLVPAHDPQRISPRVAVDRNPEDQIVIAQIVGVVRRDQWRVVERWDPVLLHPTPGDLLEPDLHAVGHEVLRLQKRLEGRVKPQEDLALDHGEIRMRRDLRVGFLPEHPVEPRPPGLFLGDLDQKRGQDVLGHNPEPHRLDHAGRHVRVAAIRNRRHGREDFVTFAEDQVPLHLKFRVGLGPSRPRGGGCGGEDGELAAGQGHERAPCCCMRDWRKPR